MTVVRVSLSVLLGWNMCVDRCGYNVNAHLRGHGDSGQRSSSHGTGGVQAKQSSARECRLKHMFRRCKKATGWGDRGGRVGESLVRIVNMGWGLAGQ